MASWQYMQATPILHPNESVRVECDWWELICWLIVPIYFACGHGLYQSRRLLCTFWKEPTRRQFRRSCSSKRWNFGRNAARGSIRVRRSHPPLGRLPESQGFRGQASCRSRCRDHIQIVRPRASRSERSRKRLDHLGGRAGHDPTACRDRQGSGRGRPRQRRCFRCAQLHAPPSFCGAASGAGVNPRTRRSLKASPGDRRSVGALAC
jgi:hypothetical protein